MDFIIYFIFLYVIMLVILFFHEAGHALMLTATGHHAKGFTLGIIPHVNAQYNLEKIKRQNINVDILLISLAGIFGQIVFEAVMIAVFGINDSFCIFVSWINLFLIINNLSPVSLEQLIIRKFMPGHKEITTDGAKALMVIKAMIEHRDLAKELEAMYPSKPDDESK